jgi:thiol-disulfide isomerase/thioredoxin
MCSARLLLTAFAVAFLITGVAADRKKSHRTLEVGSIPHDELGKDVDGNPITVSQFRGKVVIISFWASWCPPCREELPVLASVATQAGPDHLKVIAINYHDEYEPFKYMAKKLKSQPITILQDANSRAAGKYRVKGIPRMIIIDRSGKVAADHTGYGKGMIPELVDQLNELLRQTT